MSTIDAAATVNATLIYQDCVANNPNSAEGLLTCLTAQAMRNNVGDQVLIERNTRMIYNITLLFSASLAFFMQAGFAMVCAGAVRRKNVQNTMLKNLLDACGAAVAFYAVGYAFAYGERENAANNGFIGTTHFFLRGVDDMADFFFQYAFSAAAATIVAGTLAERCQMAAYFLYSILLSGFVYPVVVHSIWSGSGFFSASHEDPMFGSGVVDIAGSGVVHLTGGVTALFATYVLGPRRGRFHDEQTGELLKIPKEIKGHNIGLQLLGTLILWFGWYGFNPGSAFLYGGDEYGDMLMALAAANTTIAGGTAGCTCLFVEYYLTMRRGTVTRMRRGGGGRLSGSVRDNEGAGDRGTSSVRSGESSHRRRNGKGRFDLLKTMNGVLSGLVAITAGCCVVAPWAALLIGVVSGLLYIWGSWYIVQLRLDDAVDAIPVHMINGIWGLLAVGLFATPDLLDDAYGNGGNNPGLFYRNSDGNVSGNLLLSQVCGALFVIGWSIGVMLPFFMLLDRLGMFRVNAREEVVGLDKHYFGNEEGPGDVITQDQVIAMTKEIAHQINRSRHGRSPRYDFMNNPNNANNHGSGGTDPTTTTNASAV